MTGRVDREASNNLEALAEEWPALSWASITTANEGAVRGLFVGGGIVVGRDFVTVYVQGIPGPVKAHDGTIAGVRKAVRASLAPTFEAVDLLDPRRAHEQAATAKRAHDLANEVQALRLLVDEVYDTLAEYGGAGVSVKARATIDDYRNPDAARRRDLAEFARPAPASVLDDERRFCSTCERPATVCAADRRGCTP